MGVGEPRTTPDQGCLVSDDGKRGLIERGPIDIEAQPRRLRRRDKAVNDGQLILFSEPLDVLGRKHQLLVTTACKEIAIVAFLHGLG